MSACLIDEPLILIRKRKGRPRIAPQVHEVSFLLPVDVYDLCCREALSRDVSLAVVFREAIIYSRRQRGELR